jgi:hypothetical protein
MEAPLTQPTTVIEETSTEFLGQWNRLVSTTNWEKGRIVCQWRETLIEAGAAANQYTDEAWARQVGHVSPQHVGRLRRVHQRFSSMADQFPGLYWSHFQAALDWPDAEMYLEGAVRNDWSVSQMRQQRWEAIGAPPDKKPRDEDIFTAELDEDAEPIDANGPAAAVSPSQGEARDPGRASEPPFDESDGEPNGDDAFDAESADEQRAEPVRPFAHLRPLPPDLAEIFERFKLAILQHKVAGWQEVACDDVLAALDSLKQLALAPAE